MKKEDMFNLIGEVDEVKVADALNVVHKKRKLSQVKWGVIAACFCLTVFSIGLLRYGYSNEEIKVPSFGTENHQIVSDERNEPSEESHSEMKVNLLKEIPTLYLDANVDPGMENFIPMEKNELLEFYGYSFDLAEVVPKLHEAPDEYGVYKWPGGGYYTLNSFQYFTEDKKQTLSITMEQGKLPITGLVEAYDYELESSLVNGIEVILAKYCKDDKEMMFAQFKYQDIGFFVTSEGISVDSFLDVVEYLTNR